MVLAATCLVVPGLLLTKGVALGHVNAQLAVILVFIMLFVFAIVDARGAPKDKSENMLLNLAFNIIIPTLILSNLSGEEHLGVRLGLVEALIFPFSYGSFDFIRTRKLNFFSIFGVVSVLLTGGISLMELDPMYIAVKEASIPALFAGATLVSLKTRYPLVKTFLFNEKLLRVDVVNSSLAEKGNTEAFERVLINATYILALSFVVSSILNFVLARIIMVSPPGTAAYNVELGKMTFYSYFVIMIPSMSIMLGALYYLFHKIKQLTSLALEDIFHDPDAPKPK